MRDHSSLLRIPGKREQSLLHGRFGICFMCTCETSLCAVRLPKPSSRLDDDGDKARNAMHLEPPRILASSQASQTVSFIHFTVKFVTTSRVLYVPSEDTCLIFEATSPPRSGIGLLRSALGNSTQEMLLVTVPCSNILMANNMP
jgi:hypothetical protein